MKKEYRTWTFDEVLAEVTKFLQNTKTNDVVQYSHFVKGVYIVQSSFNKRFSPNFQEWLDDNHIHNVFIQAITQDIYTILVRPID